MIYLTEKDVLSLHNAIVEMFRQDDPVVPSGVRDYNLFSSACARPMTGFSGHEKYKTLHQKVAALFHSLACGHTFHNGNKRTALLSAVAFLEKNKYFLNSTDDETFDFVISVAGNRFPESGNNLNTDQLLVKVTEWFRKNTTHRESNPKSMRTRDFLQSCKSFGATVREAGSGGSWIVHSPTNTRSIRIGQDTYELDGRVVKSYLSQLGLSEAYTGASIDEFQAGYIQDNELLRQFKSVLVRLAEFDRKSS